MECARCGFVNPVEFRYCGHCGSALQQSCPQCAHTNHQEARFCNRCGSPLGDVCPQCGDLEEPNAHFCSHCGFRLEKVCVDCQTINPLYANFCNECGKRLPHLDVQPMATAARAVPVVYHRQPPRATASPQVVVGPGPGDRASVEPIEESKPEADDALSDARIQRLQEYIPEALRKMILSTKGKIEGERKTVTIVFADVSGFTALSERFADEPEEIARYIDQCHKLMSDCIYRYEGIIDKIVGDEVMALFGAPISHENDAERAILTALDMIEVVTNYGAEHNLPLNLHVGINTGTGSVGDIGAEGRLINYTVMGDCVNLASRLEGVAEAGEIAVGEETYRLTRRLFEWPDEPRYVEVKGKTGSQPVYMVLGHKIRPRDTRGFIDLHSQMIGRDREFQSLLDAFDKVEKHQGQLGVVRGDAGLGKSRLKREFKEAIEDKAIWIEGQCLSHTPQDARAYSVFTDALQNYFGIISTDTEDVAREKLTAGVTQLFDGTSVDLRHDMLPFLFRIMGLPLDEDMEQAIQYLEEDPVNFRHRTFFVLHDLIERVAEQRPVVLALEDLHWVDELSIDLILFLMKTLLDASVFQLCVYRPERTDQCWKIGETARANFSDVYTEVVISRLEDEHMATIFHSLLNLEENEENKALEQLVLEKVGGNPFYMEEMIRSLLDDQVLVRAEGEDHYVLTQPVEDIEVPPGVEAIIRTRIDRLDDMRVGAKRTLQHASVIGRVFEQQILEGIVDEPAELPLHFDTLEQLELISPVPQAAQPEYQFQHLLTYQISYDSLILRRRRELHGKVGAQLETLYPIDRYPGKLSEIANHYRRSDNHPKAATYLLQSGQYEQSLVNFPRAYESYREVLERLPLASDEMDEKQQREMYLLAYEGLGDICRIRGHYRRNPEDAPDECSAEDTYTAALEYAADVAVKARLLNKLGAVYERLAEYDKSQAQYEQGLELIGDQELPERVRLRIKRAWLDYRYGKLAEAKEEHLKALGMLEGSDDYLTLSEAYKNLAIIQLQMGEAEEAFEAFEQSTEIARKTNDELLLATLYNNRAEVWRTSRSVDEAIEWAKQGLAIREKYGALDAIATSKVTLGTCYRQKSDLERTIQYFEEAIEAANQTGNIRLVGDIYGNLGIVAQQRHDIPGSIEYYERSQKIMQELNRPRGIAICQLNIGDSYRQLGRFDEAEEHLLEAIQKAEQIGNRQIITYAYHSLAEMAVDQGRWEDAVDYCEQTLEHAQKLGDQRLMGDLKRELGRAHIGMGDLGHAQEYFNEARKLYAALGDTMKLAEIDAIIDQGFEETEPDLAGEE